MRLFPDLSRYALATLTVLVLTPIVASAQDAPPQRPRPQELSLIHI